MKTTIWASARTLFVVALITASCGGTQAATNTGDADAAGVQEANAEFYRALNVMFTGDVGPMKQLWSHADDVTYMGPAGGLKVGWTEVLADWQTQAAMKLGGSVEPENVHIIVGRDIAVVVDVEKGKNVDADGNPLSVSIRATNTFRREGGAWKMIGHHTDLLPYLGD